MAQRRLALNTEGEMTYCSASEENIGKGRCNHIEHQKDGETQMQFMNRVSDNKTEKPEVEKVDNPLKSEIKFNKGSNISETKGSEINEPKSNLKLKSLRKKTPDQILTMLKKRSDGPDKTFNDKKRYRRRVYLKGAALGAATVGLAALNPFSLVMIPAFSTVGAIQGYRKRKQLEKTYVDNYYNKDSNRGMRLIDDIDEGQTRTTSTISKAVTYGKYGAGGIAGGLVVTSPITVTALPFVLPIVIPAVVAGTTYFGLKKLLKF